MPIIVVDRLCKSFGKHQVLKNLSFTVDSPGIVALVGPNGVGKTTLFSIMVHLLAADSGHIEIQGRPHDKVEIFQELSYLKDATVLYPYLSAYDHLLYASRCYGLRKERVFEISESIGISSYLYKRVSACSLGMKQHILLALALLNDPAVLILDEPMNGLDPSSVIRLRERLIELAQRGKTILLSSHALSEVDLLAQRILFLKDGVILEEHIDADNLIKTEARYRELYLTPEKGQSK